MQSGLPHGKPSLILVAQVTVFGDRLRILRIMHRLTGPSKTIDLRLRQQKHLQLIIPVDVTERITCSVLPMCCLYQYKKSTYA